MSLDGSTSGTTFERFVDWQLLYTKPHAERWVEANLRNQAFAVLLPRVSTESGGRFLFPRYVFAGYHDGQQSRVFRSTRGVAYVVRCGEHPALVPPGVISEIYSRMDEHGIVHFAAKPSRSPLFAARERDRVRALVKLAAAGFRVKSA